MWNQNVNTVICLLEKISSILWAFIEYYKGKKKHWKKAYTLVVLFFTTISMIKLNLQKWIAKSQAGKYWQQSLKQAHVRSAWEVVVFHNTEILITLNIMHNSAENVMLLGPK